MGELLDTRTLYSGWGRYLLARIRLASGEVVSREVEDHGIAAAVLPYCPGRRCAMLVGQLRAPALVAAGLAEMLEAPAGRIESAAAEADARREVEEETGLRVGDLEPVTNAWPMPGISTERIALFLAPYRDGDRVGPGGGLAHEGEEIRVVELGLDALWAMAGSGALSDMKTVLLLYALRHRRPDLFGPGPADRE